MDTLQSGYYFSSAVHYIEKPQYLQTVSSVFDAHIEQQKQEVNEIYPAIMTGNMVLEPSIQDFCQFIVGTAWNILKSQGYAMDNKETYFHSIWGQKHHKYSNMEQHVHNDGVQIVGFYFLKTPEKGSRVIFHDPRTGKKQLDMLEADSSKVSEASESLVFEPKPGAFFFSNAWLPHSFSRNASDETVDFIHFNINVRDSLKPIKQQKTPIVV